MKEKLSYLYTKYHEVIAYVFWGVLSTIVCWGSYSLLMLLFKGFSETSVTVFGKSLPLAITIANVLSWIIAVAFAFVSNKIRVFQSRNWIRKVVVPELLKFLSARIVTGIVEIVGVPLLVLIGLNQTIFGIEGMLSKVVISVVVIILNYIFSKFIVFRKPKES